MKRRLKSGQACEKIRPFSRRDGKTDVGGRSFSASGTAAEEDSGSCIPNPIFIGKKGTEVPKLDMLKNKIRPG
ncbi:MAG: hypothetical protein CW346_03695 [Bacillaceae bacterium]|jgi:hypothetical protein|uniref:Uncharacterized protein n=1 Tax=Caldibacillus debilis GB1 TaxID=1339248 RepID=A0A420VGN9_9BACI|nr:hypothetical protein [Bacillaceae bacterium]MBY6271298.1 hypothetical protein [Bacillaceae bacterium]RKO62578.1 hypothetical protein Cdeb_03117 [Caldibacillus debilis GB1]